jgi:hypothetical protein
MGFYIDQSHPAPPYETERYWVKAGSMGNYGEPADSANNHYEIRVKGGVMSVNFFFADQYTSNDSKEILRVFLRKQGLTWKEPV